MVRMTGGQYEGGWIRDEMIVERRRPKEIEAQDAALRRRAKIANEQVAMAEQALDAAKEHRSKARVRMQNWLAMLKEHGVTPKGNRDAENAQ